MAPGPPTGIICGNDLQAMGVYEAARRAGLRIPDDLSVVGFDDLPTAGWCAPRLTTVRPPRRAEKALRPTSRRRATTAARR